MGSITMDMAMERPTKLTIGKLRINYLLGDSVIGSIYAKFKDDNNLYEVLRNSSRNEFQEKTLIQLQRVEYRGYMIAREWSSREYDVFHESVEAFYSFAEAVDYFKMLE